MKQSILILCTILFAACSSKDDRLLGTWKVESKFYKATYQIVEEESDYKGLVLYYNDGTSKYTYKEGAHHYLFESLEKSDDSYVDGVSGATVTEDAKKDLSIRIKHKDTLEVTTYVLNKPIQEYWTRK